MRTTGRGTDARAGPCTVRSRVKPTTGRRPGHRRHDQSRPPRGADPGGMTPSGSTVRVARCATPRRDAAREMTATGVAGNHPGAVALTGSPATGQERHHAGRTHTSRDTRTMSVRTPIVVPPTQKLCGTPDAPRVFGNRRPIDAHRCCPNTRRQSPGNRDGAGPAGIPRVPGVTDVARKGWPHGRIAMHRPDARAALGGVSAGSTPGDLQPDR